MIPDGRSPVDDLKTWMMKNRPEDYDRAFPAEEKKPYKSSRWIRRMMAWFRSLGGSKVSR